MLKLMKLDWTAIKCYRIRCLLIPVALLVNGIFSTILMAPLGVFLLFSFSINFFAVEEQWNLNRLYLTLPVNRNRMVVGRYLLSLLLFLTGILSGFALMPFANLFSFSRWYPDWKWRLALGAFCFLIYALMNLAMYPVLFKLGYQKGRIWGYYIPCILTGLIYLALVEYDIMTGGTFIRDALLYAAEHILTVSGGILLLGAAVWALSLCLSLRIYARREF